MAAVLAWMGPWRCRTMVGLWWQTQGLAASLKLVSELLPLYRMVYCVLYDRACSILKRATAREAFNGIRYWAIDKFHARGHGPDSKCFPLNHKRLERRLKEVHASISEQVFAWFRGYSSTFNSMNPNVQRFYVLAFARRRNAMQAEGDLWHLNPWSAHNQEWRRRQFGKKRASHSYNCRAVAKTHVKKKPAAKM